MDCQDMFLRPINGLPAKCSKCGFPDLDFIPQSYFVVKSKSLAPNELAMAANGNFFVRARIREVLELIAPDQCSYFPTQFKGSTEATPWYLAVPKHQVATAKVKPSIRRCKSCGEPCSAHPGTQYSEWLFNPKADGRRYSGWTGESEFHILKSSTWASSDEGWDKWISRELFMSVRLLHLLRKINAKGFYEATCSKPTLPDKDESSWVGAQVERLKNHGIQLHPSGTLSDLDKKWFGDFLRTLPRTSKNQHEIKSVEKRLRLKLPKSYADFITKVGSRSFKRVDENHAMTVHVVAAEELDGKTYRRGALQSDDEETNAIDGLMFAWASDGDCFCFNIEKGRKEYEVFVFRHELNHFEPYAESFAACLKRFVGDSR
jgi:hypothetical protein